MNNQTKILGLLFCTTLSSVVCAAQETPSKGSIIDLLAAKSKLADIAIAQLLIPKMYTVVCNKKATVMDYATAIFFASAMMHRRSSMLETGKFLVGVSIFAGTKYSNWLKADPTTTLVLTAMAASGAYIGYNYVSGLCGGLYNGAKNLLSNIRANGVISIKN